MLSLIDWRREIFEIYSDIRRESNGKTAWEKWRVKREELFKHHPESPTFNIKSIPGCYAQPILYPYNPNFCLSSKYKVLESSDILELITDDNSITRIQPFLKTTDLVKKLNIELTIFKILGKLYFTESLDTHDPKNRFKAKKCNQKTSKKLSVAKAV